MSDLDRWVWRGIDAAALRLTRGGLAKDQDCARMVIRDALIEAHAEEMKSAPKPAPTPDLRDDGGPAFPCPSYESERTGEDCPVGFPGMDLRDFFAAFAVAGSLAHYGDTNTDAEDAAMAYRVADAMIVKRRK